MSRRTATTLLVLACLAPGSARAAVVRDGADVAGPLDLAKVKLGQHDLRLRVRIETVRPLPRLNLLGPHPSLKPAESDRFLCLNLASPAIGRRLLCPAGRIRHGRLDVGLSVVGKNGTRRIGSVRAAVKRGKRTLSLAFSIRGLGLKPGRLTFSGQSSWHGPECEGGEGSDVCRDRAPRRGSGRARVYPVRRVGCDGLADDSVINGPGKRKEVALTFDDGPSVYTPEILRVLEDRGVHATFFQIGEQVPALAAYSRRILAHGSELGNHSVHHTVGPGKAEIAQASRIIESATGFRPCMFRPPTGVLPGSTQAAVEALQMVSVRWDVETSDYMQPGAGTIYSRAIAVNPGSIVLMHDGGGPRRQTVDALPRIIKTLRSRGYRLVTLTELLNGRYEYAEVHHRARAFEPISLDALLTPPVPREGP